MKKLYITLLAMFILSGCTAIKNAAVSSAEIAFSIQNLKHYHSEVVGHVKSLDLESHERVLVASHLAVIDDVISQIAEVKQDKDWQFILEDTNKVKDWFYTLRESFDALREIVVGRWDELPRKQQRSFVYYDNDVVRLTQSVQDYIEAGKTREAVKRLVDYSRIALKAARYL